MRESLPLPSSIGPSGRFRISMKRPRRRETGASAFRGVFSPCERASAPGDSGHPSAYLNDGTAAQGDLVPADEWRPFTHMHSQTYMPVCRKPSSPVKTWAGFH